MRLGTAPLAVTSALAISSVAANAQTTPGDQTGTPTEAGKGQSAAASTDAPASPEKAPIGTTAPVSKHGLTRQAQADSAPADIIVTARRIEERLQDVPISITAFNQEQLSKRNILTSTDLATYTPSLSANQLFGSSNSNFSIRGFVQIFGSQPSVGVYFADVVSPRAAAGSIPAGDGAGPGNFFDLQNVQVLKGPQGTLFGRNTTGGAILFVPQKPTSKFGGYVEGSYGNYDMKRIEAVLNIPLSDMARLRIGVDHADRDGYLKNDGGVGPRRYDDLDYTTVRASIVLDLTPDLENYTVAYWTRSDSVGDSQKLFAADGSNPLSLGALAQAQLNAARSRGADFYTVQSAFSHPYVKQTTWQVINTTTWRATDDITIKNIASYAQLKERIASGIFGTLFDASDILASEPRGTFFSLTDGQPTSRGASADQNTITEEMQIQGTALGDKLHYQSGAYLEISQPLGLSDGLSQNRVVCSSVDIPLCNNPLVTGTATRTDLQTNFHNYGIYSQATYSLTDKLKATGGIRYTFDRVHTVGTTLGFRFPFSVDQNHSTSIFCQEAELILPNCAIGRRESSHKPTWLIDLDYKPVEDVLLYAKYTRGYRAGGISPLVPALYSVFRPEKVDSYEGGLKASLNGNGPIQATFDVAGFYNDFRDQQLSVQFQPTNNSSLPPLSGVRNADKSRIWGVEVSASVTPIRGLTFDGDYTYLNTKILKIPQFVTAAGSNYSAASSQRDGDPISLTPKNKFSITGTYTLPLGTEIGEAAIGATFTHTDRQITNYATRDAAGKLGGDDFIEALNLLNLNLSWKAIAGSSLDLALFATNVTGQKYYTFIPGLLQTAGFDTGAVGAPRMYGARLRYRFK